MVEMRCKLVCNDSSTTESVLFVLMWVTMFNESNRELNYMAELAGISTSVVPRADHLLITCSGYNDRIENFVGKFFKKLSTFNCKESLYNIKVDEHLRAILNSLYAEPYSRTMKFLNCMLQGGEHDVYRQLEILSEMSFE